jgi:RNA polymerase sigma-70 factor (ECF subfamily)
MTGRILPFAPLLATRPAEPRLSLGRFGRIRRPAAAADDTPLDPREAEQFRRLILPLMDSAYSFARFLCRDAGAAEDLAQDAFLRAFRGFRGFRGGEPRAWLFAIVRSSYATWAQRRDESHPDPEAALEAAASEDPSPEATLVQQGEAETLRAAVMALPEPFRETLVLREFEELSYREIASVTGVPTGTVMSRLARARQMLLAALPLEELRP